MAFRSLQSFVRFLEDKKDLRRISVPVDPVLEITEIVSRVAKENGPALLFENVEGSQFPLVVNTLATPQRIEWALGRSPKEVGQQLGRLAHDLMPPSPKNIWKHRSLLPRIFAMKPKKVGCPPIFETKIEPAGLEKLPIAQSWPLDGGKFITFPLVMTKSPDDGKQNVGIYRMHVYGPNQTGMHWQIAKGGGYHYQQAQARNESLRIAVAVGADPILMLSGVLPLPEGLDEMTFAGFLRGESTRITHVHEGQLAVPAEAEFILEGFVPPHETRMEGPYGDHFGHYSLASEFPVFHVDRIHHRKNAIFPISVVGKPPQEDQVLGDTVQELLLPLLKVMHPEVVDMWAYQEAGFHNLLVVSVKQRFQKEAVKTGLWVLGEGQLSLTKCVILVDPEVNARNFSAVLNAIGKNFDPSEDFTILPGTSMDTLDFTSFKMNLGSKMILDATHGPKASSKKPFHVDLGRIKSVHGSIQDVHFIDNTLLLIQTAAEGRSILEKMISLPELKDIPLVAAVSPDVPLHDSVLRIWGLFTRFDCARDVFFSGTRLVNGHALYSGTMWIDATWKKGYPAPLEMSSDVVKKVDKRWAEYGLNHSR